MIAGQRGGVPARWRRAGVAAAALALPLAASGIAAAPASAAGGYRVTHTIPVGSSPYGVAVDPAAGTAYVPNYGDGTVSVIDEATNTVTRTIPVGSGPYGVAVDPASRTVYVTNSGDGTVSVINEATDTVTHTIPAGAERARMRRQAPGGTGANGASLPGADAPAPGWALRNGNSPGPRPPGGQPPWSPHPDDQSHRAGRPKRSLTHNGTVMGVSGLSAASLRPDGSDVGRGISGGVSQARAYETVPRPVLRVLREHEEKTAAAGPVSSLTDLALSRLSAIACT